MQSSAIIPNAKELKRNKSCEKCKSECAAAALPFTTKLHVVLVFTLFFFPNENMISCQERTHLLLLYEELELEKKKIQFLEFRLST